MKTKILLIYFFTLFVILTLGLSAGFYFFDFEKKNALQSALLLQQQNALELITEQIYGDLLIDNTMEVERKLNVMIDKKTIAGFKILKYGDNQATNINDLCQTVYFDKINKVGEWGKFCLSFSSERLNQGILNLRGITIVVVCLAVFLVLMIAAIFRKISQLNFSLHEGVKRALDASESESVGSELWEPVLGQLREESRKKKKAEEQLLKKQILEEKILLAQQVSHDIRSPLSVLNILKDELGFKDGERKRLFFDAVTRINETASELLSKTKSESKLIDVSKSVLVEMFELAPIIDSIIAEKKMTMSGVDFQINFVEHGNGLKAFFKPAEFKRVISNLLNNAIESLEADNGKINIELSSLEHKVQLSITDNGKGIPEEVLSRVGTVGFSHGKSNSESSGSGLGLYHARQTIESFGGSLSLFSKPNEGTMIVIELNS